MGFYTTTRRAFRATLTHNVVRLEGFEPVYLPVMSRRLLPHKLKARNLAGTTGFEPVT